MCNPHLYSVQHHAQPSQANHNSPKNPTRKPSSFINTPFVDVSLAGGLIHTSQPPASCTTTNTTTLPLKSQLTNTASTINVPSSKLSYTHATMGSAPPTILEGYDCSNMDSLLPVTTHEGKPSVVFKRSDKQRYLSMLKHVLDGKFSHGRPTIHFIKEFFINLKLKGAYNISLYDTKHLFIECTPLRIDSHNVNRVKLGTAFVCVELDVSKPLMNETWISFVDDEDPTIVFDGFWQKVEYDDVPPYCLKCFRMGHKVEDCKRDFEKEQGKGPQAPYVHRRRLYRRVLNPTKAVQPKATVNDVKKKGPLDPVIVGHVTSSSGTKESDLAPPLIRLGHVVEKWIKKLHTKNNGQGKNKQEGVQTNNSFACLENVLEEEKDIAEDAKRNSMAKEVTVGKNNVHTTAQTNNTFAGLQNVLEDENDAMAETKGSLRDEGDHTTVGEEHVQTNNSFAGLEVQSVDHAQSNVDGFVATGKDGVLSSLVVVDKL
ncbi:hypothetical protein LIER_42298 [Lithospermum erythrorhizon]|uniref:DUF4283 domain-containing protein n=1 Tax=Lithospermum erythrorhizon TaxID=34254 RepID=A0AAV3RME2_LITER